MFVEEFMDEFPEQCREGLSEQFRAVLIKKNKKSNVIPVANFSFKKSSLNF